MIGTAFERSAARRPKADSVILEFFGNAHAAGAPRYYVTSHFFIALFDDELVRFDQGVNSECDRGANFAASYRRTSSLWFFCRRTGLSLLR
jgi:hypothetical protein